MKNSVTTSVFLALALSFSTAFAQDIEDLPPTQVVTIATVAVQGLERTERFVVDREMLFKPGDVTTIADVEESVQRLRNLGLFRTADYTLSAAKGADEYDLSIVVDERWTLLPLGSFNFGGNLFSLVVGAFDVNILGRYLELGATYQRLGTTNSFVVWAHDPRFLNRRLFAGMDFAWTNRLRYLYTDPGGLEGGYLRFRRQLRFFGNQEIERWLSIGATLSLQFDEFSYDLVPEEVSEVQEANGGLPDDTRAIILSTAVIIGRINANSYQLSGVRFVQSFSHSNEIWGATESFTDLNSEIKGFYPLPLKSYAGVRAGFGITSSEAIEQQYFVGGFGTLRGFTDSRFRGSMRWYSNVEYRIPSFDYRWFVLQHIFFLDAAGATNSPSGLTHVDGASTGLGLRVIIPKIYNFVARIDYAFPVHGQLTAPLSFGAQQFF